MNTTPVPARMPQVTPAVLVSQSTATPSVAASARPQPYKYTSNMRNPPQSVSAVQQQQVQQPAVHVQGQEPLTATMLASADANEQKQMLGERLFPLIQVSPNVLRLCMKRAGTSELQIDLILLQQMYSDLAGKITGMLLEIDNSDLLHMLEHQESLKAKVWYGDVEPSST